MDPISQAVAGAIVAQSGARWELLRAATLAGVVGGLLPDADVLISSERDPLLFLEYHRQFTHSLAFIPIGGLLAAALCWPLLRKRLGFLGIWLFATLGYASHGLLDACTSYGTYLLWPFSDLRVAWRNVSIIDPLFTLPVLATVVLAAMRRRRRWALAGVIWGLAYLLLGAWQIHRVESAVAELAAARGHPVERLAAHPSLGNLILWRSTYESNGRIHVDALRLPPWRSEPRIYPGGSVRRLVAAHNPLSLPPDSTLYRDLLRFDHFSDGWLGWPEQQAPYFIGDVRYSLLPQGLTPLWGVEIDPGQPGRHAPYLTRREIQPGDRSEFWRMLWEQDIGSETLP